MGVFGDEPHKIPKIRIVPVPKLSPKVLKTLPTPKLLGAFWENPKLLGIFGGNSKRSWNLGCVCPQSIPKPKRGNFRAVTTFYRKWYWLLAFHPLAVRLPSIHQNGDFRGTPSLYLLWFWSNRKFDQNCSKLLKLAYIYFTSVNLIMNSLILSKKLKSLALIVLKLWKLVQTCSNLLQLASYA